MHEHLELGVQDVTGEVVEISVVNGPGPGGVFVHPLAQGTRIRHVNQAWAKEATAEVRVAHGPYGDDSYEYEVVAGEVFASPLGPDNPMTRLTQWSSQAIVVVPV